MDSGSRVSRGGNRFLDALPAAQRRRLTRSRKPVFVAAQTVLFEPGQTIEFVDFPSGCVISLVTPFTDGISVEVATVGDEGMVGVPTVLGGSLAFRAVVAVAGWTTRVPAAAFLREVHGDTDMREWMNDYLQALFDQIAQATACNRLHSNEARLSRWLLTIRDRVGADEVAVTLEFLGQMLGTRPTSVALCVNTLQTAGLIEHRPGRIRLVDIPGLEGVACECYATIKTGLARIGRRSLRRSDLKRMPTSRV